MKYYKIKKYMFLLQVLLSFSIISYGQQKNVMNDYKKQKVNNILKSEKMEQIVLSIKFTSTAENKDAFKQILKDLFVEIKKEPHFVNVVIHEGMDKKNEFLVYETWNMNFPDFLKQQMSKPYMEAFEQSLKDLQVTRDPAVYTPIVKYGSLD